MEKMKFYKIIFEETGDVVCYAKNTSSTDIASEVCGLLGEGYVSEEIDREEYERETEDIEDDENTGPCVIVRDEELGITVTADDGLHFFIDMEDEE
jgi:hypothetical protein